LFPWLVLLIFWCSSALAQSPLLITSSQLPDGYEGEAYSAKLTATGGTPPYVWSLPWGPYGGLNVSPAGVFYGVPTTWGTFSFGVSVTDAAGTVVIGNIRLLLVARLKARPECYGCLLPYGAELDKFEFQFFAAGGVPPYSWALVSGSELPPGLTLKSDGWITGTPTKADLYLTGAAVTDATGRKDYALFFIWISPGIYFVSKPDLPEGTVGKLYSTELKVESTSLPPYTWTLTSGQIPDGLSISSKGVLSGTPRSGGAFSFTVQASDAKRRTVTQSFNLFIISGMEIVTTTLDSAKVGEPYRQSLRAAGGSPIYRWELVGGTLPPGLQLSVQGELSGTPTHAGVFNIELKATDEGGQVSIRKLMLKVLGVLAASPAALQFTFDAAKPAPSPRTVSITAESAGLNYTAAAVTTSGGNWLSVTPRQGATPASLLVSVNPIGLVNGEYSGVIYVTSESASNSPFAFKVSLTVTGVKTTVTLVNGASFSPSPSPVAPGSIAALFGDGFPETASFSTLANAGSEVKSASLPSRLENVEVKVNDVVAPLFFAGAGAAIGVLPGQFQVNLQIPTNLNPGTATVQILYKDALVAGALVNIASAAPGVFALGQGGKGQAAAINQDGSLNGDSAKPVVPGTQPKPAPGGSVITVYATGTGGNLKDYATGAPAAPLAGAPAACDGSTLYVTKSQPVVTIGGKTADVTFSGLAPCYVGLWQLNVRVPTGLAPGSELPLVVTMDQQTSNVTTVAVK
jgi:uncharacterized protein (TIGR03437 family)